MFCVSSDLNSGKKVRVFHFGGGLMSSVSFSRGGGLFCAKFQNRGVLVKFGQNFLEA